MWQTHQANEDDIHDWDDETKVISTPTESRLYEAGINNPVWATRGWTFQEQYFSRRRIILDGDSIRWECSSAIWREHVQLPSHLDKAQEGVIGCESIVKPRIPSLSDIGLVLEDYNKRNFTFPEDCLYAFEGMSWVLSPQMAGRFVSGLPSAFFDVALLWQPGGKILRRMARDPTKAHCLPSWSWAGWSGRVELPDQSATDFIRFSSESQQCTTGVTRTLLWKSHKTPNSAGTPIHASILDSKDMWISGRIGSALGWSKHLVTGPPAWHREHPGPHGLSLHTHFYTHEAHPQYEFWYPIPVMGRDDASPSVLAPYISCQSRRAWMFPDKDPWLTRKGYPLLSLRDRDGAWTGILQPHDSLNASGSALQRAGEAVQLVEIAAGYCWDTEDLWSGIDDVRHPEKPKLGPWYEYYWVMWVEWTEGIAYRKGLGRIYKGCWEERRGEPFKLLLG